MTTFHPGIALLAFLCGTAIVDPTPDPVSAEIDAMLSRLEASGCRFQRNGS